MLNTGLERCTWAARPIIRTAVERLPTLASRRGDIKETFKIIKGCFHEELSQDMFERSVDVITKRHDKKLF